MCGIIGYAGKSPCLDLIFQGLKKLEYRGYDSSGVSVLNGAEIHIVKAEGKLGNLAPLMASLPQSAKIAMGHTRWATHGRPSTANAHPHGREHVAIIHNGIIENYKELKIELLEEGGVFHSETDSEIIVHLLQKELDAGRNILDALKGVSTTLVGAYALGIQCTKDENAIYLVKQGSPLVVCEGEDGNLFASDSFALMTHGERFYFLEDGEVARITADSIAFWTMDGLELKKEPTILKKMDIDANLGPHRHYMIKEIHDQGAMISSAINRLVDMDGIVDSKALGLDQIDLSRVQRIHVVGCGTAYHAGACIQYLFEPLLKMPVHMELASEFRYRQPWIDAGTLVIATTQSGETADTLASVKYAKSRGCQVLSICNVEHSSISRHSDGVLYMRAGTEICVASTKAFVSMLLNIYLLGAAIAQRKGLTTQAQSMTSLNSALRRLPNQIQKALSLEKEVNEIAKSLFKEHHCLFLGRGLNYILAMEGALKLKEISYIHAEAYAGGELKHGPIALVDKSMPLVALVPLDEYHDKMLSNVEEVCARGGRVIGIGSADDQRFRAMCEAYIPCPQIDNTYLQAIISAIPLQFLAYHVAVHRGTDVDQPRNLAKSVTVE